MNIAIITAAGSGSRFGSAVPKQFIEIDGRSLLLHTLEKFEACNAVDAIIVTVPQAYQDSFEREAAKFGIKKMIAVVAGGETRAHSVLKAFERIDADADIVLIHDGARPLVSVDEIAAVAAAAKEHGAACLTAFVTDTIKRVENGKIAATVDRRSLRRALTPQGFRRTILERAFAAVELSDEVTDECSMAEKIGVAIADVPGSSSNIKVTTPDDLLFVRTILNITDDKCSE